jgi:hypothetical protein
MIDAGFAGLDAQPKGSALSSAPIQLWEPLSFRRFGM